MFLGFLGLIRFREEEKCFSDLSGSARGIVFLGFVDFVFRTEMAARICQIMFPRPNLVLAFVGLSSGKPFPAALLAFVGLCNGKRFPAALLAFIGLCCGNGNGYSHLSD